MQTAKKKKERNLYEDKYFFFIALHANIELKDLLIIIPWKICSAIWKASLENITIS